MQDRFVLEVAGLAVEIQPMFRSTREYLGDYVSSRDPEHTFAVLPEHLRFEQDMLDREAREEGMRLRRFTDPFLERAAIQRRFADLLLRRDTLLLHGSAVALDGLAYVFTARCGTGKSTHTRLWREVFGERAQMLNDDKPFLTLGPKDITAHGSPWSGKHALDTNISLPLQGICVLDRGSEDRIRPMTPEEALPMLLHQSFPPTDPEDLPVFRTLVERLARQAPLWHMECTKDQNAARVAYGAMGKGKV